MHDWPAKPNAALAILGTAARQSPSGSTTTAALPPSSSATFIFPAQLLSCQPTSALPVKLSIFKRESERSPATCEWSKGITFTCPAGIPASSKTSASNNAESGVRGEGLSTIVLPLAKQGATLWATRFSGKLNGVMPRMTPIGNRRTNPKCPAPGLLASMLIPWPGSPRTWAAANWKVNRARSTSASANVTGLPASATITSTNSCRRLARRSQTAVSFSARSKAGIFRVFWNAECALATASSTSSAEPVQTSASLSPDQGL